jgi:hypothetical protein
VAPVPWPTPVCPVAPVPATGGVVDPVPAITMYGARTRPTAQVATVSQWGRRPVRALFENITIPFPPSMGSLPALAPVPQSGAPGSEVQRLTSTPRERVRFDCRLMELVRGKRCMELSSKSTSRFVVASDQRQPECPVLPPRRISVRIHRSSGRGSLTTAGDHTLGVFCPELLRFKQLSSMFSRSNRRQPCGNAPCLPALFL